METSTLLRQADPANLLPSLLVAAIASPEPNAYNSIKDHLANLAQVEPEHFPTYVSELSLSERAALLAFAQRQAAAPDQLGKSSSATSGAKTEHAFHHDATGYICGCGLRFEGSRERCRVLYRTHRRES